MKDGAASGDAANPMTGREILEVLSALANPHRIRIVAALAEGRQYMSQLARDIGMSRPLLHMHMQRLSAAGIVEGSLEVSADGKAMRFYELRPFGLHIDAAVLVEAAKTLGTVAESETRGD